MHLMFAPNCASFGSQSKTHLMIKYVQKVLRENTSPINRVCKKRASQVNGEIFLWIQKKTTKMWTQKRERILPLSAHYSLILPYVCLRWHLIWWWRIMRHIYYQINDILHSKQGKVQQRVSLGWRYPCA